MLRRNLALLRRVWVPVLLLVLLPACGMRQYTSCLCSTPTPWRVSLTLLRGPIARHIGGVSSAVRLSVHGRHSVRLLLRRTVGHALHGRASVRATAVATTAIASGAASAAASSRASVRGLVDADGASIKST